MRADVAAALSKSAEAFHDTVWPVIADGLGGGELVPVESVTSTAFAQDLDVLAGVDAWQVRRPDGMRPIASRVQAGWGKWETFTIRWSLLSGGRTEIDKRLDAIRLGFLFPSLTVQAYLDCPQRVAPDPWTIGGVRGCTCRSWAGHPLLSVAHVDTTALYGFADDWRQIHGKEDDLWRERDGAWVKDVAGGNRMLVVRWRAVPGVLTRDMVA